MGVVLVAYSLTVSFVKSKTAKNLLLYLCFATFFTFVTFSSKPGVYQYYLTNLAIEKVVNTNDKHAVDFNEVDSPDKFWEFLEVALVGNLLYPTTSVDSGKPLERLERLNIIGHGRSLGATRIRQVRGNYRECDVPSWLRYLYGTEVFCAKQASKRQPHKDPMPQVAAGTLGNFTKPFLYRTSKELGSTSLAVYTGQHGTYGQGGFALDLVPNVPTVEMARLVLNCRGVLDRALQLCDFANDGGSPGVSGARGVKRRQLLAGGCSPLDPDEVYVARTSALPCMMKPCEAMPDVSFEDMLWLAQNGSGKCGHCECLSGQYSRQEEDACFADCQPKELALRQIRMLKANGWIDEWTRAVIIDLSVYNYQRNLFTTLRLAFEVPVFGRMVPSYSVRTYKLYRFVTPHDKRVFVLEILLILMLIAYCWSNYKEARRLRWSYFKIVWNYFDWAVIILVWWTVIVRLATLTKVNNFGLEATSVLYVDFPTVAFYTQQEITAQALALLLVGLKLFKYLQDIPRVNGIMLTIIRALFDLFLFTITFIIVVYGFSASFYVAFSGDIGDMKTLGDTLGALLRSLLGQFAYADMAKSNRYLAPFLFYVFNIMVFFILLNMFVAILDDSFAEIKSRRGEQDVQFFNEMRRVIGERLIELKTEKKTVRAIGKALQKCVLSDDIHLDRVELTEVLAPYEHAYAVFHVKDMKEVFLKYDLDCDGVLNKAETRTMIKVGCACLCTTSK
eukprot:jgi/Mesvir1/1468/Mv14452-RA.1